MRVGTWVFLFQLFIFLIAGRLAYAQYEYAPPPIDAASAQEYGILESLFPDRLNLNTATRAQLQDIPGISRGIADSILAYRKEFGPFLTPYELAYIPSISRAQIAQLLRFGRITQPVLGVLLPQDSLQIVELAQRASYPISLQDSPKRHYKNWQTTPQGSPLALLTRATYTAGGWLRAGFKAAKAPNEPFFHSFNPYGYGFYSGFVELSPRVGRIERLIIGDFSLTAGYGLAYSSFALRFPLYRAVSLAQRATLPRGVFAYNGSDYPTGVALSMSLFSSLQLTMAYAAQPLNARLSDDDATPRIITRIPAGPITSLRQVANRRRLWLQQAVVCAQHAGQNYSLGAAGALLYHQYPFAHPYPRRPGAQVPPQELGRVGAFGRVKVAGWEVWGELAYQIPPVTSLPEQSISALMGTVYPLLPALQLGCYYYFYGAATNPLYEYSYALSSKPADCQGLMLLVDYEYSYNTTISLRYANQAPSASSFAHLLSPSRRAIQIHGTYAIPSQWSATLSYSFHWTGVGAVARRAPFAARHHLHAAYEYRGSAVTFRSHILGNATQRTNSSSFGAGFALAQDVDWKLAHWRIRARLGYHDATASGSPLFLYEPAPRYSFPIGMLTRAAVRPLLMVEYVPFRTLSLSVRFSKDFYVKNSLSSSPAYARIQREAIRAMIQIRYQFSWRMKGTAPRVAESSSLGSRSFSPFEAEAFGFPLY